MTEPCVYDTDPYGPGFELHHRDLHGSLEDLRGVETRVFAAWDYAQAGGKGSKNPVIRARKLYRMVRELIEERRARGKA